MPPWPLTGRTLHRVHRANRSHWWFATVDSAHPRRSGRFDLAAPSGSCYLATSIDAAIVEALQHDFTGGLIPESALRCRAISSIEVPAGSPPAAHLTSKPATGAGITTGLWSDPDRDLTHRWATELHGSGWQAICHGAQHDTTLEARAVTLFDRAGAHPPWGDDWPDPQTSPLSTPDTIAVLADCDITVVTDHPDLAPMDHIEP